MSLSNEKEIALEVTVTNVEGDDAYEASINATFPKALSYSSYRVLSKYVRLTHTHTHTLTLARTHTHTHKGTHTHRHAQAHTHTHATHMLSCTNTYANTHI